MRNMTIDTLKVIKRLFIVVLLASIAFGVGFFVNRVFDNPSPQNLSLDNKKIVAENSNFSGYHTLWWYNDSYQNLDKLDVFLEDITSHSQQEELFLSISWADIEVSENVFNFNEIDRRIDKIVSKNINLYIILDVGTDVTGIDDFTSVPAYLWEKYPNCQSKDFYGNFYRLLSFGHNDCIQRAYNYFEKTVMHLNEKYSPNIIAYQPNFNNEYEARYSQFGYRWQDYSIQAVNDYRNWLRLNNSDINYWQNRWGISLDSFGDVNPPNINYNNSSYPDLNQAYYDWQKYREDKIVSIYSQAADVIHSKNGKLILHFGEWMTANDAIYTVPILPLVKKSKAEYVIVDSNLQDAKGNKNDPIIGAILISAVKRFDIPIIYEAAVERMDTNTQLDKTRIKDSLNLAVAAGATGVSLTNLSQPNMEKDLLPINSPTINKKCKTVIYYSRWQSYAFHGTTLITAQGDIDPLQSKLFDLYKMFSKEGCVEIWDDELVTESNLRQINTLVLTNATVMKQNSLNTINASDNQNLKIIKSYQTAKYIFDDQFVLKRQ